MTARTRAFGSERSLHRNTLEKGVATPCPLRHARLNLRRPRKKAELVEHVRKGGKSIGAIAKELELTETAVCASARQAEVVYLDRESLVQRFRPRNPGNERRETPRTGKT